MQLQPPRPAPWRVFTSGGVGFLASGLTPYTGKAPAPAEIQRTTDQGRTWATVWRGSGYRLTWIGTAGYKVVAAGLAGNGLKPFLLEGNGAGTAWDLVDVSVSSAAVPLGIQAGTAPTVVAEIWGRYRFHFVDESLGFATPDPMVGQATALPGELLRTTDGGRHWSPVVLLGGEPTAGVAFVSTARGFVTGTGASNRCENQIWATSDGGSTWRAVPGTCRAYLLTSLAFTSAVTGFAAGGQYVKYVDNQQLDMLKTTDGGRHWYSTYRASVPGPVTLDFNPFADVAFFNPLDGLALDGGQTAGGSGPIGGHLWRTTDGGRTWSELGVKGLRLVLDGRHGAWLVGGEVGQGGDVLWRSLDLGRTWAPVGNPGRVRVSSLAGYGAQLWVSTEAGVFRSGDAGRTWHPPPAALRSAEESTWPGVPVELAADGTVVIGPGWAGDDAYWLSSDGGQTGHLRRLPSLASAGVSAIAFSDPRHGLALGGSGGCGQPGTVLATADGGAVWHRQGNLEMIVLSLAYDGSLVVAAGSGCNGNAIAISSDSGRTWSVVATGNPCGPVSVHGQTVAMLCANLMPGGEYVLLSHDGGRWWVSAGYNPPRAGYEEVGSVVATGANTLWASGPPGILWRTSDGGNHWAASRLSLPLVP